MNMDTGMISIYKQWVWPIFRQCICYCTGSSSIERKRHQTNMLLAKAWGSEESVISYKQNIVPIYRETSRMLYTLKMIVGNGVQISWLYKPYTYQATKWVNFYKINTLKAHHTQLKRHTDKRNTGFILHWHKYFALQNKRWILFLTCHYKWQDLVNFFFLLMIKHNRRRAFVWNGLWCNFLLSEWNTEITTSKV